MWTGSELVVWGGLREDTPTAFNNGARYELAADTWAVMAPSPLEPRSRHLGIWTGREVIFWGGIEGDGDEPENTRPLADGAAYDPETDSWRMIAEAPLLGGTPTAASWTGSEMIVLGSDAADVASYDPASDTWSLLPSRPVTDRSPLWISAFWTESEEMISVVSDAHRVDGLVYDTGAEAWRELPRWPFHSLSIPVTRGSPAHVWDGSRLWLLTFAPQETGVVALDFSTDEWQISEVFPGLDCTDLPSAMSTDLGLLVVSCRTIALLIDGTWSTVPTVPQWSPKIPGSEPVWTSEGILLFDAGIEPGAVNFPDGFPPGFWIFPASALN